MAKKVLQNTTYADIGFLTIPGSIFHGFGCWVGAKPKISKVLDPGSMKTCNFFQGFPFGAKAADEDGVGYWNVIPTSGLDGLVPYSDTAPSATDENSLPVPVPVIESAAASANKPINAINLPITSPSDEESNAEFFELVDSNNTTPSTGENPTVKVAKQSDTSRTITTVQKATGKA